MAFNVKMDKADQAALDEALKLASAKYQEAEKFVEDYNRLIAEKNAALEDILREYNEAMFDVRQTVESFVADGRSAVEDMSEKWQDGERGQQIVEWLDELDNQMSNLSDASDNEYPAEIEFDQIIFQDPATTVNEEMDFNMPDN